MLLNFGNWTTEDFIEALTIVGSPSIDATAGRDGKPAARINPSASTQVIALGSIAAIGRTQQFVNFASQHYITIYLWFDSLPAADTPAISLVNASSTRLAAAWINSSGQVTLVGSATSGVIATITTGVWYKFKLRGGANSDCGLSIDDGSETTVSTGAVACQRVYLGAVASSTMNMACGEWVISDISDSAPSLPEISIALPTGSGNYSSWADGTGSTFAEVDEIPHDGSTTYLQNTAGTDVAHTLAAQDSGTLGISDIEAVKVIAIMAEASAGITLGGVRLRSGSTDSDSTATDIGDTTYVAIQKILATDPNTSASWTESGFDAIEVGVYKGAASHPIRCTAVYALVLIAGAPPETTVELDITTTAAISLIANEDLTTDAALLAIKSEDINTDAVLSTTNVEELDTDAAIELAADLDLDTDSVITVINNLDLDTDAIISSLGDLDLGTDSSISITGLEDLDTDAAIQTPVYEDLDTDASISVIKNLSLTTSASIIIEEIEYISSGLPYQFFQGTSFDPFTLDYASGGLPIVFINHFVPPSSSGTLNLTSSAAITVIKSEDLTTSAGITTSESFELNTSASISHSGQADVDTTASIELLLAEDLSTTASITTLVDFELNTTASIQAAGSLEIPTDASISTTNTVELQTEAVISITIAVDIETNASISHIKTLDLDSSASISNTESVDLDTQATISIVSATDITTGACISLIKNLELGTDANIGFIIAENLDTDAAISVLQEIELESSAVINISITKDLQTSAAISVATFTGIVIAGDRNSANIGAGDRNSAIIRIGDRRSR